MGKLPGFTFYTGDWLKDPELRRCSKAAKGVWIDMLALMFECADRGVFKTANSPWGDQEIAVAIGGDIAENLSCLRELLAKGVASRDKNGCIFSRRMVLDELQRQETKSRVRKFRKRECNADVTPVYEDENEIEVVPKERSKSKPSLEEVCAYCAERKNSVDPQKWFDYYSSNGWRVGKNPLRDWRAAVRTWERNGYGGPFSDNNAQTTERRNGVSGGTPAPARPNTQAQRAFSNIAAVAAVLGGSNRMAAEERSTGMADRRLTDGSGQKA